MLEACCVALPPAASHVSALTLPPKRCMHPKCPVGLSTNMIAAAYTPASCTLNAWIGHSTLKPQAFALFCRRPFSSTQSSSVGSPSLSCDEGLTAWVAFVSKKGGQSQKSSDLDDEKGVMDEADLQYKPLGFGHGKDYDLSLEEKLLEEIERDKAAQAAAVQKRKNNVASTKGSRPRSTSANPAIVDGIKVWVGDLPKKKNIDRDLRSAFRHIPGLLDISPSVQGNEKTRDPICKGFGYLTFDTMDHARSFISSFQDQPISFGKVERKLKMSLVKANEADMIPSEKGSQVEVGRLRIRDKDAANVVRSDAISELVSSKTVGQHVSSDDMQETVQSELCQPQMEVTEDGETIGTFTTHGDSSSEEDDGDDDDIDLDDESEMEISVDVGEMSGEIALRDSPKGTEKTDVSDAEKRIEELERRIIKKLEDAGYGAGKGKHEKETVKGSGFDTKKIRASKRSPSKGNNVAAVTYGLKKREREFMTGVLEKYGKSPSASKP